MVAATLVPTELKSDDHHSASVEFEDGHVVRLVAYQWCYPEDGIRNMQLLLFGEQVAIYIGRTDRRDRRSDAHTLSVGGKRYTPQLVAAYWRAARDYIMRTYANQIYRQRNAETAVDYGYANDLARSSGRELVKLENSMQ